MKGSENESGRITRSSQAKDTTTSSESYHSFCLIKSATHLEVADFYCSSFSLEIKKAVSVVHCRGYKLLAYINEWYGIAKRLLSKI